MRSLISTLAVLLISASSARADTVTCTDGTTSGSGRGACSHHGGVAKKRSETKTKAPARTTSRKAPKSVTCEDGTTSVAGRGACSHHGGIEGDVEQRDTDRDTDRTAPTTTTTSRKTSKVRVTCSDGTTSVAGRGACSHHSGIQDDARTRAERRADVERNTQRDPQREPQTRRVPELPNRQEPTARCQDGSLSYSAHHTGTCSYHGGVAEWLTN